MLTFVLLIPHLQASGRTVTRGCSSTAPPSGRWDEEADGDDDDDDDGRRRWREAPPLFQVTFLPAP